MQFPKRVTMGVLVPHFIFAVYRAAPKCQGRAHTAFGIQIYMAQSFGNDIIFVLHGVTSFLSDIIIQENTKKVNPAW